MGMKQRKTIKQRYTAFKATWRRIAASLTNDSPFLAHFGKSQNSQIDYATDAGLIYDCGAVGIGINKTWLIFSESPIIIQEESKQGTQDSTNWQESKNHPLVKAIENPNPYYDDSVLWYGTLISLLVSGNAYWLKVKDRAGRVAGFHYLPHLNVTVENDRNNEAKTKLITHYNYTGGGSSQPINIEDIIHFRYGVDPQDARYGLSPLAAVLREVVGDNAAGNYAAAILRNFGAISLLISPKTDGAGEMVTPDQLDRAEDRVKRGTTGDAAGSVVALGLPTDVKEISATPEKMALDSLRKVPADRIFGALGMDPMIAGQESASKTYSNYEKALEAFVRNTIIPLKKIIGKQIKRQCLDTDFKEPEKRVYWDFSEVWVLQDDINEIWKTASQAYMAGVVMRSDARRLLNLESTANDDVYYTDLTLGMDQATQKAKADMQKAMRTYRDNFEREQEQYVDTAE